MSDKNKRDEVEGEQTDEESTGYTTAVAGTVSELWDLVATKIYTAKDNIQESLHELLLGDYGLVVGLALIWGSIAVSSVVWPSYSWSVYPAHLKLALTAFSISLLTARYMSPATKYILKYVWQPSVELMMVISNVSKKMEQKMPDDYEPEPTRFMATLQDEYQSKMDVEGIGPAEFNFGRYGDSTILAFDGYDPESNRLSTPWHPRLHHQANIFNIYRLLKDNHDIGLELKDEYQSLKAQNMGKYHEQYDRMFAEVMKEVDKYETDDDQTAYHDMMSEDHDDIEPLEQDEQGVDIDHLSKEEKKALYMQLSMELQEDDEEDPL